MANLEVKNKNVYTKISCTCSTYLCHWENYSGRKALVCSAFGCTETKDLVGAHVINCSETSGSRQYITPLCKSCNSSHNSDCFKLNASAILVAVSYRSKCKPC
jgi:hypothetical protein